MIGLIIGSWHFFWRPRDSSRSSQMDQHSVSTAVVQVNEKHSGFFVICRYDSAAHCRSYSLLVLELLVRRKIKNTFPGGSRVRVSTYTDDVTVFVFHHLDIIASACRLMVRGQKKLWEVRKFPVWRLESWRISTRYIRLNTWGDSLGTIRSRHLVEEEFIRSIDKGQSVGRIVSSKAAVFKG